VRREEPDDWEEGEAPLAGFWVRAGAMLIDAFLVYLFFMWVTVSVRTLGLVERFPRLTFFVVLQLLPSVIPLAYHGLCLWRWGRTAGKLAAGIKVVTEDDEELGPLRALGRTACYALDVLTLGLGFLAAAWPGQHRALHDYLAGTKVVYTEDLPLWRTLLIVSVGILGITALFLGLIIGVGTTP